MKITAEEKKNQWQVLEPYYRDLESYKMMLPFEPTEKNKLTRNRFMTLKTTKARPTVAEMKEILNIINPNYKYQNDSIGYFRKDLEDRKDYSFIFFYWDILYPDAEPSVRFCLAIQYYTALLGKSETEIARAMSSSQSYFSCVYTGVSPMTFRFCKTFCETFDIQITDFFKQLKPPAEITQARNRLSDYLQSCVEKSGKSKQEIAGEAGLWNSEIEGYLLCRRSITLDGVQKLCAACPEIDEKKYLDLLAEGKILRDKPQKQTSRPITAVSTDAFLERLLATKYINLKAAKRTNKAYSLNFVTLLYLLFINDWKHPEIFRHQITLYLRRTEKETQSIAQTLRPGFGANSSEIFFKCLEISGYTLQALSDKTGVAKSFFSIQKGKNRPIHIRLAKLLSPCLDYPLAITVEEFLSANYAKSMTDGVLSYEDLTEIAEQCPDTLTFTFNDTLSIQTEREIVVTKQQLKDALAVICVPEYATPCDSKYEKLIKIFSEEA